MKVISLSIFLIVLFAASNVEAKITVQKNCKPRNSFIGVTGIDSSPFTFDGRTSLGLHMLEIAPDGGHKFISIVHSNFNRKVCSFHIKTEGKPLLSTMLVTRNISDDWDANSTEREKDLLRKELRRCNAQKRKVVRNFSSSTLVWNEEFGDYLDLGMFVGCERFIRGRILSFELQNDGSVYRFFIIGHRIWLSKK